MATKSLRSLPTSLLRRAGPSIGATHAPPTARTFFTLPFSSPNPSQSQQDGPGSLKKQGPNWVYEEGRQMNYTPQELYAIIADVDAYQSFLPFCTTSSVLAATVKGKEKATAESRSIAEKGWLSHGEQGDKWELEAELKVGAMGFQEGYVSKVECVKWETVSAKAKDSSIFRHLHTQWSLSPLPPSPNQPQLHRTQVDLYLAYAFSSPFHAAAVSAMWEKVSRLMIDGFEKRAKKVYRR